ncbi:MAG: hypothetical protein ACSHYF_18260 [Verrucomicrobiaceae bacterium]
MSDRLIVLVVVKSDYEIEELVSQTGKEVLYRAKIASGERVALRRLVLADEIKAVLDEATFEAALEELKGLDLPCLRGALDGGVDEVDGQPWIVTQWWDGEVLEDRLMEGSFDERDLRQMHGLAQVLIGKMGSRAGALSFAPKEVVRTVAGDGSAVETFTIDVVRWFEDWARGMDPGSGRDAQVELGKLVELIQGPPIVKPVLPPVVGPPVQLASAKSGGGGKVLVVMGVLGALVGGALWMLKERKEPAEEPMVVAEESGAEEATGNERGGAPAMVTAAPSAKMGGRPEKPAFEWLKENHRVSAIDGERLGELKGQWVNVRGWVKAVSGEGEWVFELAEGAEVPLKARLESASDIEVEGRAVSVVGFLEKDHLLKIPKVYADDIIPDEELVAERNSFVVGDEAKVIKMKGKMVRLTGKVTAVEVGGSGIYLHWKEWKEGAKNVFAAKIPIADLSKTYDQKFFKVMKGKTIRVTGVVTQSGKKRGWYVLFKRNKDFEVLESQVVMTTAPEVSAAGVDRPSAGEMSEVKAGDEAGRKKNAGRWVIVEGRVKAVNDEGEWVFEGENGLRARLKAGEVEEVAGKPVSVVGWLKTAEVLEIDGPDDVDVLDEVEVMEEKEVYTMEDEVLVRSLGGQTISLRAKVLDFHESKRTYYLEFTTGDEKLAARIYKSDAGEELTAEYLESLEGKEITVTGLVYGLNNFGGRFEIEFKSKEQIKE